MPSQDSQVLVPRDRPSTVSGALRLAREMWFKVSRYFEDVPKSQDQKWPQAKHDFVQTPNAVAMDERG